MASTTWNQYYVRGTNGTDSVGGGTSHSTAYKTIQYAIDDIGTTHGVRLGSIGDKINLCDESAFVLSAALTAGTYGAGDFFAWLVFQGYTTTTGDGGVFDIDLNAGAYSVISGTHHYWAFVDGKIHNNTGSFPLWSLAGVAQHAIRIEFYDSSYRGFGNMTGNAVAEDCYFHDIAGIGIYRANALGCYFKNGTTNKFTYCVSLFGTPYSAIGNICSIDGSSGGIYDGSAYGQIVGNSVFSNGGTGAGIQLNNHTTQFYNNYAEGFSGAGGVGFHCSYSSTYEGWWRSNASYDNETDYKLNCERHAMLTDPDNEVLSASGLAKSGADTFANRRTYFAPQNEGNMLSGMMGWQKGAVQPAAGGGSASMLRRSSQRGGYE